MMGKVLKQVLLLVTISTALMVVIFCIILPTSPRLRQGYGDEFSHKSQEAFQTIHSNLSVSELQNKTKLPNMLVNKTTIGKLNFPEQYAVLTTSTITKRFVRLYENLNLTGPTVSPIVHNVEWLEDLSQISICNETDPFILAMVFSAIPNTKERQRIRRTWANPELYKQTKIRAIFVLGATNNTSLQRNVEAEIEEFQDIVQYNYIDSYRNLTYKTLSWMSWVRDYCLDVPWIAKIDDDVIVNPFNLNTYLVDQFKKNPAPNTIHGRMRDKNKAMRGGKWGVTQEEYPPEKYPPFVLGPAYIVGRNAIDKLLEYAPYTPFLWLEDVYMTGLVAHAAGIRHTQAERILYTKKLTRKLYRGPVAFYIGASERNKRTAWAYIIKYGPMSN